MVMVIDTASEADKRKLYEAIKGLKPGHWVFDIKPQKNIRSVDQNSYYWFVLNVISLDTGQDSLSLHDEFKRLFNSRIEFKTDGKYKVIADTTTFLDTGEFTVYLDKVIRYAEGELGIIIPRADRVSEEQFRNVRENYKHNF